MEESMNDLRVLAWVAIEAKVEASESPPPMDKRVLTEGFFCCTVWVKVENWAEFEEEMVTWEVLGLRSAKAQKRWVKRVESMLDTGNPLLGNQYAAFTTACPAEKWSWRRKRRVENIYARIFEFEAIENLKVEAVYSCLIASYIYIYIYI
jgi:hypothetical protein